VAKFTWGWIYCLLLKTSQRFLDYFLLTKSLKWLVLVYHMELVFTELHMERCEIVEPNNFLQSA
jgi:hypothetical protein